MDGVSKVWQGSMAETELGSEEAVKAAVHRLRCKIIWAIEKSSIAINELCQQRRVTTEMLNTPMVLIYEETKMPPKAALTDLPD